MLVAIFGLFNLITAIFVDNVVAAANVDFRMMKKRRRKDKEMVAMKVKHLVQCLWEKQKGKKRYSQAAFNINAAADMAISDTSFNDMILDGEVQDLFADLGIDRDELPDLFEILDADGSGQLDLKELVSGVLKLRGDAKKSDVVSVAFVARSMQASLTSFGSLLKEDFNLILKYFEEMKGLMKASEADFHRVANNCEQSVTELAMFQENSRYLATKVEDELLPPSYSVTGELLSHV